MTEPTVHQNHDHVYTGLGDNPARCRCGAVHQPDTTQRGELRERIADKLNDVWPHLFSDGFQGEVTDLVIPELDEELERAHEWCKLQGERFGIEQQRAETAEAERDLQAEETQAEHARAEAAEARASQLDALRYSAGEAARDNQLNAEAAEAKLAAVREHHKPVRDMKGLKQCHWCGSVWPCPTIRALDGDGDG